MRFVRSEYLRDIPNEGRRGLASLLTLRGRPVSRFFLAAIFMPTGVFLSPASAETLAEAMAAAATRHPALKAEEARKRAASAGVDVARSGYYPRLNAFGDVGYGTGNRGLSAGDSGSTSSGSRSFDNNWSGRWGYGLHAEQSLYDGGRTRSAVAEAHAGEGAATSQVRVAEQSVLLEAAIAFTDLVRDRQIETLRTRSKAMLDEEVKAAQERLQRGAGTATDVAQTRARHAQALADLIVAKAESKVSISEYERIIGRAPGKLERPRVPEARLPKSVQAAMTDAEAKNPASIVAEYKEQASRHTVDRLAADGLPQVKLRGGIEGDRGFSSSSETADRDSASIAVRVNVPIFDGGETTARVKQARELNTGMAEDARRIREQVRAGVTAAWARLAAGRERLGYEQEAVQASRRALDGVRQEIKLGNRTTLEGLDAQRDLVASEVRLAASERDLIVASYALLSVTGQLSLDGPQEARQTAAVHTSDDEKPVKRAAKVKGAQDQPWQAVITKKTR